MIFPSTTASLRAGAAAAGCAADANPASHVYTFQPNRQRHDASFLHSVNRISHVPGGSHGRSPIRSTPPSRQQARRRAPAAARDFCGQEVRLGSDHVTLRRAPDDSIPVGMHAGKSPHAWHCAWWRWRARPAPLRPSRSARVRDSKLATSALIVGDLHHGTPLRRTHECGVSNPPPLSSRWRGDTMGSRRERWNCTDPDCSRELPGRSGISSPIGGFEERHTRTSTYRRGSRESCCRILVGY